MEIERQKEERKYFTMVHGELCDGSWDLRQDCAPLPPPTPPPFVLQILEVACNHFVYGYSDKGSSVICVQMSPISFA